MVRRRRAPEEARAAIQEGAGMGARGCGRCALGMLGAVGARRRGVISSTKSQQGNFANSVRMRSSNSFF